MGYSFRLEINHERLDCFGEHITYFGIRFVSRGLNGVSGTSGRTGF